MPINWNPVTETWRNLRLAHGSIEYFEPLFMIVSAVLAGALLKAEFTIPQIFLFTGLANAVVAFYIFLRVPE